MSPVLWLLLISFLLLLAIDVPIAVAIAVSSFLCIVASNGDATYTVALKMANGIDSFSLLAIPFFILSGLLMGQGGIARRLIDFAAACVGRHRRCGSRWRRNCRRVGPGAAAARLGRLLGVPRQMSNPSKRGRRWRQDGEAARRVDAPCACAEHAGAWDSADWIGL